MSKLLKKDWWYEMNPHPKPKTLRLKGNGYTEFRRQVYEEFGGICQGCFNFVPLYDTDGQFDKYTCGHVAHDRSQGAGGPDTIENVEWRCWDCHMVKQHGPRWGKGDV